jgi:hypothetical protein
MSMDRDPQHSNDRVGTRRRFSLIAASTTAEGLAGGVMAVAGAAVWGHATMLAAGALVLSEETL